MLHTEIYSKAFSYSTCIRRYQRKNVLEIPKKAFLKAPKKEDQLWSHWIKSGMSYIFTLNYTTLEVFWKSNWISNMKTNVDYSFVNACNSKCHCNFTCAKFNMISVWPPTQCNLTQKRGTVDCGAVCCVFFSVWNMNLIPILTSIVFTLFSQGQNDRKRIVFFFSSLDAMCQIEKNSNNEEDSGELLKKQSNTVWKSFQKWSHKIGRYSKNHEMRFLFLL